MYSSQPMPRSILDIVHCILTHLLLLLTFIINIIPPQHPSRHHIFSTPSSHIIIRLIWHIICFTAAVVTLLLITSIPVNIHHLHLRQLNLPSPRVMPNPHLHQSRRPPHRRAENETQTLARACVETTHSRTLPSVARTWSFPLASRSRRGDRLLGISESAPCTRREHVTHAARSLPL